MDHECQYLGRFQQGVEIPLLLQCVNAEREADDPLDVPHATVYRDGVPPVLVETRALAATLRGVAAGVFRLPLFLGSSYATAGRHLVVYRWVDSDGVARCTTGSFVLLPGGSADGAVVGMHHVARPDARYLLYQTDSGRLIRGRNPR